MPELSPEVIEAVKKSADELQRELNRLMVGAKGLAADRASIQAATEALAGAGSSMTALSERMIALANEVAKLDPVAIGRALDEQTKKLGALKDGLDVLDRGQGKHHEVLVEGLAEVTGTQQKLNDAVVGGLGDIALKLSGLAEAIEEGHIESQVRAASQRKAAMLVLVSAAVGWLLIAVAVGVLVFRH